MNNFKTVMTVIGCLLLIFTFTFSIGMAFPKFRNKIYDILDTVPEKKYEESLQNNTDKEQKIKELELQLNELNELKKQTEEMVNILEKDATVNARTIENYKLEIEKLGKNIEQLKLEILNTKVVLDEATLEYVGLITNLEYSFIDIDNDMTYYTSFSGSDGRIWENTGFETQHIIKDWISSMNNLKDSVINRPDHNKLVLRETYRVAIKGCDYTFDINNSIYNFKPDAIINSKIILNEAEIAIDDIETLISKNIIYSVSTEFVHIFDGNLVSNLECLIKVNAK